MIDLAWRNETGVAPTLRISMPTNQQIAPPGYYLLFIASGTNGNHPSEGVIVKLMF